MPTEEKLYTEADLVSFGKFLLSPEREKKIYDFEISGNLIADGRRIEIAHDTFRSVTHAVVCNWKREQGYSTEADAPPKSPRVFYVDEIRKMVNDLLKEEMSMSKFTELLNEKATGIDAVDMYKLDAADNDDVVNRVSIPLKNHEGHATFIGEPSQESIDAVNVMADLAYKKLK
jgi:hypothetical protein